jgi:hypothetical protein
VALGHQVNATSTKHTNQPGVYSLGGSNTKELANIPGLTPAQPYHSLLGTAFPRFRESIVFNSKYILPAFLIAYQRRDD